MIFAAGLGTRLKPLTDTLPKALVPVGGKPLLQILIDRLAEAGFTEAVVNVHHFAEKIIDYLYYTKQPLKTHISDESAQLLETGGESVKLPVILLMENLSWYTMWIFSITWICVSSMRKTRIEEMLFCW